jgi:hypothetical protein
MHYRRVKHVPPIRIIPDELWDELSYYFHQRKQIIRP